MWTRCLSRGGVLIHNVEANGIFEVDDSSPKICCHVSAPRQRRLIQFDTIPALPAMVRSVPVTLTRDCTIICPHQKISLGHSHTRIPSYATQKQSDTATVVSWRLLYVVMPLEQYPLDRPNLTIFPAIHIQAGPSVTPKIHVRHECRIQYLLEYDLFIIILTDNKGKRV